MALKSRNLMSDSGTNWYFEGEPIEAAGYYGITTGNHTVSISVQNFVGRVFLFGTLEDTPEKADLNDGWFLIKQQANTINQSIVQIVSDGSTLIYNLNIPGLSSNVFLTADGVTQTPGTDFTYSNGILTLVDTYDAGVVLTVRIMSPNYSEEAFDDPYFDTFTGDGIEVNYTVSTGTAGNTQNVFVAIDGVQQSPFTDFTYTNGILTFSVAPPDQSEIFVAVYPPNDNITLNDYWIQFPINSTDPDQGPVNPSPVFGPRTTVTTVGSFHGNYTYIKAILDRNYIKEDTESDPIQAYEELAVGAVSQILVNY